ncbi:helix-turn-helix domain-containing protein [Burkholderia cenocepacia]|uniref:helix-turn-helix domain-containing protein n=1 Tax=Burkholderia cenocepacia TaxID=95486 RepID=UPI0038CD12FD
MKDLAEAMGFEQSYVSALELGIKGPPSRDFVDRLARYLLHIVRSLKSTGNRACKHPRACKANMDQPTILQNARKQPGMCDGARPDQQKVLRGWRRQPP